MTDEYDLDALVRELEITGQRVKGKSCTCPWHDDENPSASLLQGTNGHWRVWCHTCNRGGDIYDVRSSRTGVPEFKPTGKDRTQDIPSSATKSAVRTANGPGVPASVSTTGDLADKAAVLAYAKRIGQPTAWYKYGPADAPVLIVARIQPHDGSKKTFRQFTVHADGTYTPKNLLADGTIPLYGAMGDGTVLVVEGEKACDAVTALGIPCVTSAMGAGKAHLSDWSSLSGRAVAIWPDNDADDPKTGRNVGMEHARQVADLVSAAGGMPSIIDHSTLGLPLKGDAYDYVQEHEDAAAGIRELMALAGEDSFLGEIQDIISGKAVSVPWPWPVLTSMTKAFIPGSVTFVVGNAGATKSFMLLECAMFWINSGFSTAICELEETTNFWKRRVLAQLAQHSPANDPDWIKDNGTAITEMYQHNQAALAEFGKALHCAPVAGYTLTKLADWIESKAKAGVRMIIADPITACIPEGKEPWNEAQRFILRVKSAAASSGCSVVLATHGRKGQMQSKAPPDLDSLAGGAAYSRFASNVIWVDPLPKSKEMTVTSANGIMQAKVNRRLRILKARSGKGTGHTVGMFFDGATLLTVERGVVTKEGDDDTESHAAEPARPDARELAARATKLRRQHPSDQEDQFP